MNALRVGRLGGCGSGTLLQPTPPPAKLDTLQDRGLVAAVTRKPQTLRSDLADAGANQVSSGKRLVCMIEDGEAASHAR